MRDPSARDRLIDRLIVKSIQAIDESDLFTVAFLCRRLASELGDDTTTRRSKTQRAIWAFLSEDAPTATDDCLRAAVSRGPARRWTVRFSLSPVHTSSSLWPKHWKRPKETITYVVTNVDGRRTLTALEIRVSALDRASAVYAAHPHLRNTLQRLRTRHYMFTRVQGTADVTSEEGDCIQVDLPQPFWHEEAHVMRRIPRLDPGFDSAVQGAGRKDAARWLAARWHLARAMGDWPEDQHAAASQTWQALEALLQNQTGVMAAAGSYVDLAQREMAMYLAHKLRCQQRNHRLWEHRCDWVVWRPTREPIETWFAAVRRARGPRGYASWIRPLPPEVLFGPRVGLMNSISMTTRPMWMLHRLTTDLDYLYGLRNAAVHTGSLEGSEQWAAHLARMGLEMLLTLLNGNIQFARELRPSLLKRLADLLGDECERTGGPTFQVDPATSSEENM